MVNQELFEKWIDEYINGIDINQCQYFLFDQLQMYKFIMDNYTDPETKRKVAVGKAEYYPIGLQYLDYEGAEETQYGGELRFLIGAALNKVGKFTILSEIRFYEGCTQIARGQTIPVTCAEYIEVNSFFRKRGLCKALLREFAKVVNGDHPILTTVQTKTGLENHVLDKTIRILRESGFDKDIRDESMLCEDYYSYLRGNPQLQLIQKTE